MKATTGVTEFNHIPDWFNWQREEIKKERTPDNILSLKCLLFNGIIKIIDENVILDNLTVNDAYKLKRLTQRLYEHIYAHYTELEALTEMTDEA